jgi:hypothetical protein
LTWFVKGNKESFPSPLTCCCVYFNSSGIGNPDTRLHTAYRLVYSTMCVWLVDLGAVYMT